MFHCINTKIDFFATVDHYVMYKKPLRDHKI